MSEAIKKQTQSKPESYSPQIPKILNMMEDFEDNTNKQIIAAPELIKFEIVKFEPCRFIGKSVYARAILEGIEEDLPSGKIFGSIWGQQDWIFKTIDGLKEYVTDKVHNVALLTWEKYDDKNQLQGYTVGRFMKADTPVPGYMDYIDIPETYVAKGTFRGKINLVEKLATGEYFAMIGGGEGVVKNEVERQGMYKPASWIFLAEGYPESPDDNGNISNWEFYCACIPLSEQEKEEKEREKQAAEESEKARDVLIKTLEEMVPRGEPVGIDLTAMIKHGTTFDLNYVNRLMEIKAQDESGMTTPQKFNAPLKIELRAKTDSTNIRINYGKGMVIFNWECNLSELRIHDIADGKEYGYQKCGSVPVGEFVDIEWILDKEFMAIKINGELRHIGNNYEYIKSFKDNPEYNLSSAVTITAFRSTVTVEKLRITEI